MLGREKRLRKWQFYWLSSGRGRKITHKVEAHKYFGNKQYFGFSVYEVFGAGIFNHLNANSAAVSLCDRKLNIITVMEVITFF